MSNVLAMHCHTPRELCHPERGFCALKPRKTAVEGSLLRATESGAIANHSINNRQCLYNLPVITVSKEDYLKSILEAESEGETVIAARLVDWHKVTAPAVTMALRRLKKDGLVEVRKTGEIRLTPVGRKIARKLTLRHHLIERMLSEMFGMEWWKVHDEAERIEHAVSPDFEAKLLAKLGSAGACPHGNLSEVESSSSRRRRGLVLLADADVNQAYAVSGIYERDRQLLEFLESRGIRPGAKLHLLERNYDQTLTLSTSAGKVSVGPAASGRVWVTKSKP